MKVSVVIPTYNRCDLITRAVDSVLNQTYKNIEVIIVDDGSTDDTEKVVLRYARNPKVKYIKKENGGAASALNEGVRNSKGELVAWLSSDDWYDMDDNTLLEKSVIIHKDYPNVGMTYADYSVVNPQGETTHTFSAFASDSRIECREHLFKNCFINGSSTVMKRNVFYTVGFYNEFFKYAQDFDFYFRVMTRFDIRKVNYDKKPMLNYYFDVANNHACLGNKITAGEHNTEGEPVMERYRLAYDNNKKVCALLCVRNESEIIDRCINDLSMYVDNIIVIDDGSIDDTVEKVSKWKKVTLHRKQKRKFGQVREEGKDRQLMLDMGYKTNPDYFFFIDADEQCEERMKTEIYKMINDPSVNLWFFHEENFWRNTDKYTRIDELYNLGWFGRLFKAFPNMKYNQRGEHCCGIPEDIPCTSQWFCEQPTQRKSSIRVKHYGFCSEERILSKVRCLWAREKGRITFEQMYNDYSRLLREDGLTLSEYYETPFYLKTDNHQIHTITGDQFGYSQALKEELVKMDKEQWLYSKDPRIADKAQEELENAYKTINASENLDYIYSAIKTKNIVHINLICDPAGVSWLLHKSLLKHGYNSEHLLARPTVNHHVQQGYGKYIYGNLKEVEEILNKADVLHINMGVEDPSKTDLDLTPYLKDKPFIIHNHGGPNCLDPYRQINPLREISPDFVFAVCSPLTKYIVPEAEWVPNIVPIDHPAYKPIMRDFDGQIYICHKVFSQGAKMYKGDDVLNECINDFIAKTHPVKLDCIYGMPAEECLNHTAGYHICIDNLTQGFIGMAGWESLSKGQVVIARLDPLVEQHYNNLFGCQHPIQNVSGMDEMCDVVRKLAENRKRLRELCEYSREWMEKYYNEDVIIARYARLYHKAIKDRNGVVE